MEVEILFFCRVIGEWVDRGCGDHEQDQGRRVIIETSLMAVCEVVDVDVGHFVEHLRRGDLDHFCGCAGWRLLRSYSESTRIEYYTKLLKGLLKTVKNVSFSNLERRKGEDIKSVKDTV